MLNACSYHTVSDSVDQQTLDVEIERLRDELKPKVSKLHKMEGTTIHSIVDEIA